MREVYEELLRAEECGTDAALAIVTAAKGSTPQVVGAKMVVRADGTLVGTVGGGRFEKEIVDACLQVIAEGEPRTVRFELTSELAMCCGGTMEAYIEPVRARARMVIFGAGHVGRATGALARSVGMAVTVVDHRPEWANPERFPGCQVVVEEVEDALDVIELRPTDFVLITTHDHGLDRRIAEQVLEGPQAWTGMIGSRRKAAKTREYLGVRGRPQAAIDRLASPVGLDIGARTPEEIAVSIVGEVIERRNAAREKRPRPRVVVVNDVAADPEGWEQGS